MLSEMERDDGEEEEDMEGGTVIVVAVDFPLFPDICSNVS